MEILTANLLTVWNPDSFIDNYQFFKGRHAKKLQQYINEVYTENSVKMRKRTTYITKRNIMSAANVYKYGVTREFEDDKDVDEEIEELVTLALMDANRFDLLDSITALWYSLDDDERPLLQALPAWKFTVEFGDGNDVKAFYVRIKQVLVEEQDVQHSEWLWYKYENNTVWAAQAQHFSQLTGWVDLKKGWSVMPFLLLHKPSDDIDPELSPLVETEMDFVAGMSLTRMSALVSQMQLLVAMGANREDVEKLFNVVGKLTGVVGLNPNVKALEAIEFSETQRHLDFQSLVERELESQTTQIGGNFMAIIPDKTIKSGRAIEAMISPGRDVREDELPRWKWIERAVWRWLTSQDQDLFAPLKKIVFGEWKPALTASEAVDIKVKEQSARGAELNNDILAVQTGAMTVKAYVAKWIPDGTTNAELAAQEKIAYNRLIKGDLIGSSISEVSDVMEVSDV